MHILFLTDNFPPETNAAATRVYERACYWVKWGYQVTVITSAPNFPQGKVYPPYKNKWYQTEEMDGIKVIRVKTFIAPNKGFFFRIIDFLSYMVMAFFAGMFPKAPNVIISTSPQFFCAVSGWVLAKTRRKPFIFELSDLWPDSIMAVTGMKKNILIRSIEKIELFLYKNSAAVIALTGSFKDNLIHRGITPEKIHIIRNGVDLTRYYPQAPDTNLLKQYALNDKFVIGYIGTHGMAHALENVLNSALIIKNSHPQICFIFLGDGAEKQALMAKAEQLKLNNCLFISPKNKAILPKYWAICNLALVHLKNSPVFATVIPSKIFEAMGMGLPILFSGPAGEATQIIQHQEAGICVPAENPQILAETIIHLSQDSALVQQLAANSKNSASLFQREHQAKEVIKVLKNL